MNFFVFMTVFSAVFLNRFGLNIIGDFSLSFSYVFLYVLLVFSWTRKRIKINVSLFYLFLVTAFSCFNSFLFGEAFKSLPSLLLLFFVYFPFVFEKQDGNKDEISFLNFIYPVFLALAVAGILQFVLQFFYKPIWLFDYRPLIPDILRNKNPMNTVIPFSSFFKSNGFFLLEPSGFSQAMAMGLYLSVIFPTSLICFLLFFIGLLFSFSGTGLILCFLSLVLAFCFSCSYRKYILFMLIVSFFGFSLMSPDSLLLSRSAEFSGGTQLTSSSAAARFINPIYAVKESLSDSPKTFLFGVGPGTFTRSQRDYEAHDPVWAKLFYEYGFLGGLFFLSFIFFSVYKERARFDLSLLFFVQWFFLGGHLLSLDTVAVYVVYYKFSGHE